MERVGKRLSVKFAILVGVVFVLAVVAYLGWSTYQQVEFTQSKALAEARTLNLEMKAAWDYVDASQTAINYNSDGSFDFKDVYCSVAGKSIAQRFTSQADGYEIRFARENPRSATDAPDEFEARAIAQFRNENTLEYYGIEEHEGRSVFRYASALEIQHNCLLCHGEPAGEIDVTGFLKEGMRLGDLAGITSIVIPLDAYHEEMQMRLVQSVTFFLALAVAVIVVVRFALRRWVVDPLNRANMRLYDENKAQQDFLTIMSHELRTPLSSIIAFTDVWEGDVSDRSDEERTMVAEIKENSRTLLNLVNNTIDVAKIEANRFGLHYDEVDLVDVLQSITAVVGPLAKKNGVTIERCIARDTPIIVSDDSALSKIFTNIIGNAVKYSPQGSTVTVSVDAHGDEVRVSVRDQGPGIPEGQQERIFERFARLEGTESTSGSGLGLFLAKTLSEKLGGSLLLESKVGEGSTFTVVLPLDASSGNGQDER